MSFANLLGAGGKIQESWLPTSTSQQTTDVLKLQPIDAFAADYANALQNDSILVQDQSVGLMLTSQNQTTIINGTGTLQLCKTSYPSLGVNTAIQSDNSKMNISAGTQIELAPSVSVSAGSALVLTGQTVQNIPQVNMSVGSSGNGLLQAPVIIPILEAVDLTGTTTTAQAPANLLGSMVPVNYSGTGAKTFSITNVFINGAPPNTSFFVFGTGAALSNTNTILINYSTTTLATIDAPNTRMHIFTPDGQTWYSNATTYDAVSLP